MARRRASRRNQENVHETEKGTGGNQLKAFVYLRVSGLGQIDGDGYTRQLLACEKHAAGNDYEIAEVFREEGVSGTKELDNRPALQNLLLAIEDGEVRVILIEKLDRLARDLMVQETIIGDLRKKGIELVSVYEPDLCSDDPTRKLMRQIMGAIAEWDREMIVLKLRGARQRVKARTGRCEGRKAFGASEHHRPVIDRILSLRTSGMAVDTIAETLNAEGMKSKTGGRWYGSSVRNVILRERGKAAA
jgi:DNA invertase Pin-like site-specific DNA recombinase